MAIWLGEKKPTKLLCTEELLFGLMNCRTNFLPSTDVTCAFKIYSLSLKTHKCWKILCFVRPWLSGEPEGNVSIFTRASECEKEKNDKECCNSEEIFKVRVFHSNVIIFWTFVLVLSDLRSIKKIRYLWFFLWVGDDRISPHSSKYLESE